MRESAQAALSIVKKTEPASFWHRRQPVREKRYFTCMCRPARSPRMGQAPGVAMFYGPSSRSMTDRTVRHDTAHEPERSACGGLVLPVGGNQGESRRGPIGAGIKRVMLPGAQSQGL